MANALKLLIQRKCRNKEISWSFFNFGSDNGRRNMNDNNNNNNKCYQTHHCNNGSNIKSKNLQHDSSNINFCWSDSNRYQRSMANNKKMLQQQDDDNLQQHLIDNQLNVKLLNSLEVSAPKSSGCVCCSSSSSASSAKVNQDTVMLEFKRKFYLSKLLHMRYCCSTSASCSNSGLDQRSVFYITLLIVIYCCVLIKASAATATATAATLSAFDNSVNATRAIAAAFNSSQAMSQSIDDNDGGGDDDDDKISMHLRTIRNAANVPDGDDDSSYHDDEFDDDALINNKSAKGKYIGAPCNNFKCESKLIHVSCDKETQLCGCEKNYPVQLGLTKGCAKPKKLGEQCFYDETCIYNDENSLCVQVRHNALCQCVSGFHSVTYNKPTRRIFCTQDLKELKSDLPTLLGVSSGIAVLAGLICMVLHLFSKTKYPRHRNFGDANLPPPIMYSSDAGIPLTVQSGRPSSRSSVRSSGSIGSFGNRRSSMTAQPSGGICQAGSGSSAGSKGSRRPSLASVHSTSSSIRSYSMMRFEKESQQKEIRQEMKLRLARLQHQQHMSQNKPQIIIGDALIHHGALGRVSMSTPSPITPNSLDELLPSVDETQEFPLKTEPSTTATALATNQSAFAVTATNAAYNGPCSSSTEVL